VDELQKAEEERNRIEEEKRRKVQEEERRKVKDVHRKAEEAGKRAEEESRQKAEEAHSKERRLPHERGGRSRGPIEQPEIKQTPETKHHFLKPEIVCWNEGWRWIVGIEVSEELEPHSIAQNGELLEQDNTDETRYWLKCAEDTVKVTWAGGEKYISVVESERNYLIFKMRKNWKEPGRLVRCPTIGYYLIIVPQEWKHDEEVSGPAPVAPESVQLDGYEAHFFYQEQNSNTVIGFITANGERVRVESESPRFQLAGTEIGDASENMGPLFSKQPSIIQTLNEEDWNGVSVMVVGEEGSGRNRWRMPFVPQVGAEEQRMPDELTNRRGGWYFLRIYDKDDNLIESMDFRFMMALKDIHMEKSDCLPGPHGYDDVTVQFLHQTDCKVELVDKTTQHSLEIRRESGQTIVTVPPEPNCDKSHWILRDGDAEIEVTVLVERIWWAFSVMEVTPNHWVDKSITLSRKYFTATTDNALWVRLPWLRFVRKIDVGFGRAKIRSYQVEMEKKEIVIPLRDFCDAEEIEKRQVEFGMKIGFQIEGAKTYETVVIKLAAEAPPLVEPTQRQVQKSISKGEKVCLLQAIVKSRRGKRKGKGFSKKELTGAAVAREDIKRFRISYDKRRKTSHSWNVESLYHIMRGDKHD